VIFLSRLSKFSCIYYELPFILTFMAYVSFWCRLGGGFKRWFFPLIEFRLYILLLHELSLFSYLNGIGVLRGFLLGQVHPPKRASADGLNQVEILDIELTEL
jgi:hypothetical protein